MPRRLVFALAGLETGITASLWMLGFLTLASWLTHHSTWWVPNLFASAFYGQASVQERIGYCTAAGAALFFFGYALIGVVFGEAVAERPTGLRFLGISILTALVLNWLLLRTFWRYSNPVGHLYISETQLFLAHVLLGFCLAVYPRTQRKLAGR